VVFKKTAGVEKPGIEVWDTLGGMVHSQDLSALSTVYSRQETLKKRKNDASDLDCIQIHLKPAKNIIYYLTSNGRLNTIYLAPEKGNLFSISLTRTSLKMSSERN
jgi:hypothetical protein